jgi:hypothetical protein
MKCYACGQPRSPVDREVNLDGLYSPTMLGVAAWQRSRGHFYCMDAVPAENRRKASRIASDDRRFWERQRSIR